MPDPSPGGGHPVTIGGLAVRYLTADEDVPLDVSPIGFDLYEDMTLRGHPRLRRSLASPLRPAMVFLWWLHWSDGADLDQLDRDIAADEPSPAAFDGALMVEARSFTCRSCDAGLRGMVPDGGNPINTTARMQEHRFVRDCPVCASPLGLLVAELIGADDADAVDSIV